METPLQIEYIEKKLDQTTPGMTNVEQQGKFF